MRFVFAMTVGGCLVACASVSLAGGREDLPRPRKAEPVRQDDARCAALGVGFIAVPGSQTCVKVGGYVRVETQRSIGGR